MQTPSAPVTAFVSLTAVAGDGARSAPLGPFRETANHGASADGARDNAARVFIAPDASDAVSADASACGAHWAPCADLTVALAAAVASGATFTESAPAEVVFLPGEHASAGNCGVELGAAMPVRVSGLVGSRPRAACDRARTGHFASPPFPPRSPRSSAAPPRTLGGSWRSRRTRCGSARWKSKTPPARRAAGSSLRAPA